VNRKLQDARRYFAGSAAQPEKVLGCVLTRPQEIRNIQWRPIVADVQPGVRVDATRAGSVVGVRHRRPIRIIGVHGNRERRQCEEAQNIIASIQNEQRVVEHVERFQLQDGKTDP